MNVAKVNTRETTIHLQQQGKGPPLLLLHGFPETHLMWRDVAPLLADAFTVICPDLRGYGESGCPPSDEAHTPYSKRAMANDMITVMQQLGYPDFMVAGHDRGARVAYRMALDHPQQVKRLAVLDIIPTSEVWDRADKRIINFWPWSLLSQPAPLPERLVAGDPGAVIESTLATWGTDPAIFPSEIKNAYVRPLMDPAHVHAVCEEFRAAATIDHMHDSEDRQQARHIQCPMLVLWSADGPVDTWYAEAGGPLAIWRTWANDAEGRPVAGGHFFPESAPEETAHMLRQFFLRNAD